MLRDLGKTGKDLKVVAVVGPTGSGKTGFAIGLAKFLDGEVISGDSMQVYKGMDIGTAKVTKREAGRIPHHLIDIREPGESYTVCEYQRDARKKIRELKENLLQPILCGGTGLYLDAVLYDYDFSKDEDTDLSYREYLEDLEEEKGVGTLWKMLKEIDEASSLKIHERDTKRLIRALEYYKLNGKPISENTLARDTYRLYQPASVFGISWPREVLYDRIDHRVDQMMAAGFEEEARKIYDLHLPLNSQCLSAIGYKEMFGYFEGELSLEKAVELMKQNTRHYAKRQLTWFRRNPNIFWLDGFRLEDQSYILDIAEIINQEETEDE